jgi:hypothetical protein
VMMRRMLRSPAVDDDQQKALGQSLNALAMIVRGRCAGDSSRARSRRQR